MYLKLELPNDNILNAPGIRVRTWIELAGAATAGVVFQRNALNLPSSWSNWVRIDSTRAEFRKIVEFSHMSRPTPEDIEDPAITKQYKIAPYLDDPFTNGTVVGIDP